VSDLLGRHPLTGEVLILHGRLYVAESGKFYLQYPDQTVGEYAQRNGVEALLTKELPRKVAPCAKQRDPKRLTEKL
jgi:hypothetical protein